MQCGHRLSGDSVTEALGCGSSHPGTVVKTISFNKQENQQLINLSDYRYFSPMSELRYSLSASRLRLWTKTVMICRC